MDGAMGRSGLRRPSISWTRKASAFVTTASAAIRCPPRVTTPVTRPPAVSMRSTPSPQRTSSARAIASMIA